MELKQTVSKNCTPFTQCITIIAGTTRDDAEDLNFVTSMYNLLEYSSKYSETTRSLWFHYKDEVINFNANILNTVDFKSFKYKAKLVGETNVQPELVVS